MGTMCVLTATDEYVGVCVSDTAYLFRNALNAGKHKPMLHADRLISSLETLLPFQN